MGIQMTEPHASAIAADLLVGDTRPLVGAALAIWLAVRGHNIVANIASGAAAAAILTGNRAQIAILDIDLVDPSPLSLVASCARRGIKCILLAPDAAHPLLGRALALPVAGIVLKSAPADTLERCLAAVLNGERWHDPEAVAAGRTAATAAGLVAQLTPRERDVARLVASGRRNRCIGEALGIAEGTVKMHLHNVYAKLGIQSRTQLATDSRVKAIA